MRTLLMTTTALALAALLGGCSGPGIGARVNSESGAPADAFTGEPAYDQQARNLKLVIYGDGASATLLRDAVLKAMLDHGKDATVRELQVAITKDGQQGVNQPPRKSVELTIAWKSGDRGGTIAVDTDSIPTPGDTAPLLRYLRLHATEKAAAAIVTAL